MATLKIKRRRKRCGVSIGRCSDENREAATTEQKSVEMGLTDMTFPAPAAIRRTLFVTLLIMSVILFRLERVWCGDLI